MTNLTRLAQRVQEAYFNAMDFFIAQTVQGAEGWGPESGDKLCPWTTSQVLFTMGPQSGAPDEVLSRALNWLEKVQNTDGSWWSQAYGPTGDTPATGWACVVLQEQYGPNSLAAQRGIEWLCRNFRVGITTLPTVTPQRYLECHFYSLANMLRALARARRTPLTSLTIQESIVLLKRARVPGAGWGYQADSPPDPTFTAYVLHGLYDIRRIRRVGIPIEDVREAVHWLLDIQGESGWSDWQGIEPSNEAAGYCLYVILASGLGIPLEKLTKPVEFLLERQRPDGGWAFDPETKDVSNNWITHSILLGLKAFWMCASGARAQALIKGRMSTLEPVDLDSSSLPGAEAMHWGRVSVPQRKFGWPTVEERAAPKESLYLRQIPDSMKFPPSRPYDHTMFKALDKYVEGKIPVDELEWILKSNRGFVEVHGIYPDYFPEVASDLGFVKWSPVEFTRKPATKRFNFIRPAFFRALRKDGSDVLVASVVPGKDYCTHYATMIRHQMYRLTARANELIQVYWYPDAERRIVEWTGLNTGFVERGDRVLLGYVEEANHALNHRNDIKHLGNLENDFYGSFRYRLPDGTVLNVLGVKFSFWGSISEVLATGLCQMGCTEILYMGKLGALTCPEDVYTRVFCPSRFVIVNYDQVVYEVPAPENLLLRANPELDSGCHISVPTVLEEDYVQRELATRLKAQSIDNEISLIARAVTRYTLLERKAVNFSALHLATDYIRAPHERALPVPFDLSSEEQVKVKKREMIDYIIGNVLVPYLGLR